MSYEYRIATINNLTLLGFPMRAHLFFSPKKLTTGVVVAKCLCATKETVYWHRAELDDVSGCRVACRQAIPLYEEGRIDRLLRDRTRASERILRSGGN